MTMQERCSSLILPVNGPRFIEKAHTRDTASVKAGVTAAPVYDIGQFLEDPHVQERGIVLEAPDDEMGEVPMHSDERLAALRQRGVI